jgi:hypothetical protein
VEREKLVNGVSGRREQAPEDETRTQLENLLREDVMFTRKEGSRI